jgi:hypothetical protein
MVFRLEGFGQGRFVSGKAPLLQQVKSLSEQNIIRPDFVRSTPSANVSPWMLNVLEDLRLHLELHDSPAVRDALEHALLSVEHHLDTSRR